MSTFQSLKISKFQKGLFTKINTDCPYSVNTYSEASADHIVDKKEDLQTTIDNSSPGDVIYIKDNVVFEFNDNDCKYLSRDCYANTSTECSFIIIDKPIKLVSGGVNGVYGATFSIPARTLLQKPRKLFRVESDNVTISGIKIIGNDFLTNIEDIDHLPQSEIDSIYNAYVPEVTDGIFVCGFNNLTVENCEISGWSQAGIHLKNSRNNKIINNFIHHNLRHGLGYGVSFNTVENGVSDGLITCNSFEYNRHDIAGSGHENESYEASYNIIGHGGQPSWTYSFDMHGKKEYSKPCIDRRAGNTIEIHHNKFNNKLIPAFKIRGIPVGEAYIHDNSFAHERICDAIKQNICGQPQSEFNNLRLKNNSYTSDLFGLSNNLLYVNQGEKIVKFSFSSNCEDPITTISRGWSNYSNFLVGNWSSNGTDDLIAYHQGLDELHLYQYKYDGTGFYSGYKKVSHGWSNYSNFLVGNWSNNGIDDLIAYHHGLDELHLYQYKYDGTGFYSGYKKVSHGWSNYSNFLVGNWSNNGTDDLIAYHHGLDELHLYQFRNDDTEFYSGYKKVSHGWSNYTHYVVGNWSNNGTDDLIAYHQGLDELHLYKFRQDSTEFYSGFDVIKSNMKLFVQFFANDINQNGWDDLIGITENNELYLLMIDGNAVSNTYIGVFPDLKAFLNGKWK
ncbi:NosD domain-containing protein [Aquimarina sediminis]|uniref:NosD domain-containing protein n=1 Tax=Aquimarina sediminis TaxID=2070536 RepID=UPI000CA06772|nr:right-handed parallel beta-helix repeat-containing protein [Aquimarina sediminis]